MIIYSCFIKPGTAVLVIFRVLNKIPFLLHRITMYVIQFLLDIFSAFQKYFIKPILPDFEYLSFSIMTDIHYHFRAMNFNFLSDFY